MTLTVDRLRSVLSYDPETGGFTWNEGRGGRARAGSRAGLSKPERYSQIRIDGKKHLAHRLAWMYVHGAMPGGVIDHIDGDKTNNAISNLRSVTPRDNQRNQERHRAGDLPGVTFRKSRGTWVAAARFGSRRTYLGSYKCKLEAYAAYMAACAERNSP